MKRKISVDQLQVGMFVDALDGSWLDHPFWKSAFLIQQPSQIAQLRSSKVAVVWIDAAKGLDLAPEPASPEPEPAAAAQEAGSCAPQPVAMALAPPPVVALSLQEEISRARRILGESRVAMNSMFQSARLGKAVNAEHCLPLVNEITQSVGRNPGAIVSLARLKTSDDYTYMHSVAVCALMVSLARQLGMSEDDTREAGMAGLVHDLGKAMMPLAVLNKPGKLTDGEYTIMKSHPEEGHRMLVEGQGVGPVPLDVCLHHHEKMNGKGYPHGLRGEQISLFARMGAVCDVYDAITSNRPYKAGWDPADSIQQMASWAKEGHFDEAVFQAFVKSIGIFPTGSLVKLKSGRLGVVIEQNPQSLLTPLVRVFFSTKANEPIPQTLLDLGTPGVTDQIVSRESAATWGFKSLDQLWADPG